MKEEALELLPEVVKIARDAGRKILEIYAAGFEVTHKDDRSPLTAADLAAHSLIMASLEAFAPDYPRLSEEGSEISFAERRQWQSYWLIDPLDGTREFVQRTGEFTVNIALIHQQRPVLGVVHVPAQDTSYFAAQGAGAWRQAGDGPLDAIYTRRAPSELHVLASRSHPSERDAKLLAKLPIHTELNAGSALKFGLVAEGQADFYPRLGPTSEWDTAAGQCVVEQAGGLVVGTDFKPLRYNAKDSLLNPDFYVFGDPLYHWKSLLTT
ncbi:MAG: 3'(2'),5'-bisphosphate nucleotidase CysQ [Nevskiales bacterium]